MTKQKKVKPGDLFRIPLTKNAVAVGIVLHVSKRIKNGILIGIYDRLFDLKVSVNPGILPNRFVGIPNYTGKQLFTPGAWEIVADGSELLDEAPIPKLRAAGTVYYKDEIIHQVASIQELQLYPVLKVEGEGYIEQKLRRHFGIDLEDHKP